MDDRAEPPSPASIWTETIRRIGSDGWDGEHYEIGPDADGLGCVEIRCCRRDGTFGDRMTIPTDTAKAIADAVLTCAREIEAERQRESAT